MIPTYLVVRDLGLLDSYWALILPLAINPFYLIVVKSFFQELPEALEEAARIDGCNELNVFLRIVLPLSKPIIATFSLFYAVGIWNDYMSPLLYIDDSQEVDAADDRPPADRGERGLGERAAATGDR